MTTYSLYEKCTFGEIKHKLPRHSWCYMHNESHDGEFEEMEVWYHTGDLTLTELQLDEGPFLIIVEGNLVVERSISNIQIDAASTNLIVLGDLHTPYMIVGGQEVWIQGHLHVSEMFWGDYNHGELVVQGDLHVKWMIVSNEYRVNIHGQSHSQRNILDWDDAQEWQGFNIIDLFVPECIIDEDTTEPFVWREQLIARVHKEQPIMSTDQLFPDQQALDIPFLFENDQMTIATIEQLFDYSLLSPFSKESHFAKYEYWIDHQFGRVGVYGDMDTEGHNRNLYFQQATDYALLFKLLPVTPMLESTDTENSSTIVQWQMSGRYRYMDSDHNDWIPFTPDAPPDIQQGCERGWSTLLQAVSTYQYARKLVKPQWIRDILALPIAQPYNDYYDDDRHGLWVENIYFSFRQEGVIHDQVLQPGLLRLGREYTDAQGDSKFEHYFYELHHHADGSECVILDYKQDQDEENRIELSYAGGYKLQLAVDLLKKARQLIEKENQNLLDGEAPYYAEPFAIHDWQAKGYLK